MKNSIIISKLAEWTTELTALILWLYFLSFGVFGFAALFQGNTEFALTCLVAVIVGILAFGGFAVFLQLKADVTAIREALEANTSLLTQLVSTPRTHNRQRSTQHSARPQPQQSTVGEGRETWFGSPSTKSQEAE